MAAPVGRYAELRDVSDIDGHARTQDHPSQRAIAFVLQDPRLVRIEDTAARKADDVVEEAERTVQRAVLIVDVSVDVSDVGLMDQLRSRLVVSR